MRLFAGLSHTDYQDLLRALGRYLDRLAIIDLRLIEQEDGMTIQSRPAADPTVGFQTKRVRDEDLLVLLRDAYQLRGTGRQATDAMTRFGFAYQDLLRAIGRVLDAENLRDLRLVEQPAGLLIQVTQGGRLLRGFRTYRLHEEQVRTLVRDTTSQRGTSEFGEAIAD